MPLRRPLTAAALAVLALALLGARPAAAAPAPAGPPAAVLAQVVAPPTVSPPETPTGAAPAAADEQGRATINIDLGQTRDGKPPSQSIVIILGLTLLSVAPALLIMMTGFTRIVVVLSLTRNALGLQSIPPNQVVVGLALFLSLFVMGPTLSEMNKEAFQPYLKGEIQQGEAYDAAVVPLRSFMLDHTRNGELAMFIKASGGDRPADRDDVSMSALVPAFILSELKTAFIIGFIVFVPFLVIDLVVSSSLMSMGMMMLPPVLISLPFKLLLFVMVDGWALVVRSLLTSFG
ncbi:MAG TPA: flagellar type III secretion system pore protein FliP [Acidimicrobiales bacterium]|nr:flagellar type III secretion system pore protein FliP [Acidimicrobiales bacterium]